MASLEISSPHDNDKNETALTFCHAVSSGGSFQIPRKINIVTIMNLGDNCPLNEGLDKTLQTFVTEGFKFFEYNSVNQTPACASLQQSLNSSINERNALLSKKEKETRSHPVFNIRNHVERSIMNGAILSFSDSTNALMSTMIYDEHGKHIKTVPINYISPTGAKEDHINMVMLISYLCGLTDHTAISKMNGRLTIVLIICRGVDETIPEPTLKLMRGRSETNDFLPKFSLVYIRGLDKDGLIGQIIGTKDRSYIIETFIGQQYTVPIENVELLNKVKLTGLNTVSKNGLIGTYVQFDHDSSRLQIKMEVGPDILLKGSNLIGLHDPAGGKYKTPKHKRKNTRRKHARLRKVSRK